MANLQGSYDNNAEPQADFGPIPPGEYEAEIIDSSVEDISRREDKGKCLVLVWRVISGDYAGRQVWDRLNLWFNGAEKTPGKVVQIANSQFASVREATGVKSPGDSSELHNIPCVIRVSLTQDAGYEPKNEVKHVKARAGGTQFRAPPAANAPAPAQARSAPPASRSAPASSGASRPWGGGKAA